MRSAGAVAVRVRIGGANGDAARIEVAPDDIGRLASLPLRDEVVGELKAAGFTYVALDLQGYRTGSMDESL